MDSSVTAEVQGASEIHVGVKTDEETEKAAAEGREGRSNTQQRSQEWR